MPAGVGLSIEQPAWDPKTKRFYTSIPVIANNPPGCNYGQLAGPITCDGGLARDRSGNADPGQTESAPSIRPPTPVSCRCTDAGQMARLWGRMTICCLGARRKIIRATRKRWSSMPQPRTMTLIGLITGSDEVWFNEGDFRYYTGSSRDCGTPGTCPDRPLLSRACAARRHRRDQRIDREDPAIFRLSFGCGRLEAQPHFRSTSCARRRWLESGGDITAVGAGICGGINGCVAVYQHKVDDDDHEGDDDHKDDRRSER